MGPRKRGWKFRFHSPIGSKPNKNLANIFAVLGTRSHRAIIQFGTLTRIITSWSLTRPRKNRWKCRFHSPIGSRPNWARNYSRGRNLASYLHNRSRKKTMLSLHQVGMQSKHAQNEKHLNSTKRNVKGWVRAVQFTCCSCLREKFANDVNLEIMPFKNYVSPCLVRSSTADVKQNKRLRVCHPKFKSLATVVWKWCQFWKISRSADVKVQPKTRECLLKIHFCSNFSLASLSLHPHSRRGAERIRQGERRSSRTPKTGTRTKRFDREIPVPGIPYWGRDEKTSDQILVPSKKKNVIYIYIDIPVWSMSGRRIYPWRTVLFAMRVPARALLIPWTALPTNHRTSPAKNATVQPNDNPNDNGHARTGGRLRQTGRKYPYYPLRLLVSIMTISFVTIHYDHPLWLSIMTIRPMLRWGDAFKINLGLSHVYSFVFFNDMRRHGFVCYAASSKYFTPRTDHHRNRIDHLDRVHHIDHLPSTANPVSAAHKVLCRICA